MINLILLLIIGIFCFLIFKNSKNDLPLTL